MLHSSQLRNLLVVACYGQTALVKAGLDEPFIVSLRKNKGDVVAGDIVDLTHEKHDYVIDNVHPRQHVIERPIKYKGRELVTKVFAANVNQALVVIASKPLTTLFQVDMFISACMHYGIKPTIVVNKIDLESHLPFNTYIDYYKNVLNINVIKSSVKSSLGLEDIKGALNNHTSIVMGQSGVGKSSLLKATLGEENIITGALTKSKLGAHTTTVSYLYSVSSDCTVIDTPGIREFALWHLSKNELLQTMPDIANTAKFCKFRNCSHMLEPGCAVRKAITEGNLMQHRLESFQKLTDCLKTP